MSIEQHKMVLRRWVEGRNAGNLSVIDALVDELYTADFTIHDGAQPPVVVGREGIKQFVRGALQRAPDSRIIVEDLFAEGDRVATRWTVDSTDAASGKRERRLVMEIYRFVGGQIAEAWTLGVAAAAEA